MTAEQLEELLGKVTQGDWAITGQPDKVCAEGYTKQGAAKVIVEVRDKSWMTATEQASNATLIALAPSLARRVLAAEKLVEALERVLCYSLCAADRRMINAALTAYREASK